MKRPSDGRRSTRRAIAMGALLSVSGCGRPPCFEGALELQILEIEADASTCSFEHFPAGNEWLIRTIDKKSERRVDGCVLHQAIFVERPEGANLFRRTGQTESFKGSPVADLEPLAIGAEECVLYVNSMLTINREYDDFESAYLGHRNGDDGAFYLNLSYSGMGACAGYFPEIASSERRECVNVHRANVALF